MPDASAVTASPTAASSFVELAVVRRSGLVEGRHFGSLVALASGSHTGEDEHVRVVREILTRVGLDESALGCPADRPQHEAAFEAMLLRGETRAPIRMNCSGKHAAMLLTCAVNGWATDDYLNPSHPLQRHILTTLEGITGVPVDLTAVDGCGAPLLSTSVRGIAAAFRTLAQSSEGEPAGQVAEAMRTHPFYVGGSGQDNTRLMESVPGFLAKGGAEGVIGVAGPDGSAVSMKIIDGSPRATTLIALRVLDALGVDIIGTHELTVLSVLGGGARVGEIVAGQDLEAALRSD